MRSRRPGFPLRYRMTAAFALVSAVTCALVYAYVPRKLAEEALTALTDKANTIAQITAYTAGPAIVFGDSAGIAEAVASALTDPDVVAISVLDERGQVMLSNRRGGDERVVLAVATANHAGEMYGTVHAELSMMRAERGAAQTRSHIAYLAILVFLASGCVALLMSALITGPLAQVAGAADRIAASGRFSRVDVHGSDEVGKLAETFNLMVDRLAAAHDELTESNHRLEERVHARTAELEAQIRVRRQTEQELRISEHRFRTIFEAAGAGIALLSPAGAIVDANRALQRLFSATRSDLAGSLITRAVAVEDRDPLAAEITRVSAGHSLEARTEVLVPGDDGLRQVVCMLSPVVVDASGTPHVLAVLEDVTEHRELADRYRQAQKLEAVGRLAGGVAHDFNNLLMTINGVCDLLLGDLEDGAVRRDIEQVRGAGERAAQLTRQLLAFSRRQVLRSELIDINAVVEEVTSMLRRVIGETIVLETQLAERLPAVRTDAGQMLQVIMNLTVNARDAMPDGGRLLVATSVTDVDHAMAERFGLTTRGAHVQLTVHDTGRGMDAEARAHAFEPFFTTKPAGQGTGLGLATVYGIVRQSGGGVAFESTPGQGTTFHVLLPASTEDSSPTVARRPQERPPASETVLVAEDESAVRALVCRVLRRQGYNVLEAEDGSAALAVADAYDGDIAVLLSDVVMPRCGGPELAAAMRERRPGTRIIFMSGYTPEDVCSRGFDVQADALLEKPMAPDSLLDAVRAVLAGQQGSDRYSTGLAATV